MNRTVLSGLIGLLAGVLLAVIFVRPAPTSSAAPPLQDASHSHGEMAADVSPLNGCLGSHQHPITTDSELAQRYFDEGLILTFGFNHEEAIRSFKDALKLDPECAMCYWGIAYALGPNINAPMDNAAVPEAYEATQKALELAPQTSEADFIIGSVIKATVLHWCNCFLLRPPLQNMTHPPRTCHGHCFSSR